MTRRSMEERVHGRNQEGKIMQYETNSREETFNLAKKIAEEAYPGEVFTLDGDLGVGKTVFAQGFAEGLGITEPVNSPTFTIVQIYEGGRLPLYHFDVYRIGDPEEMEEIGYEDYFYGKGISLVEWSELIKELIPENSIHVRIRKEPEKGFDYRRIEITGGRFKD
jgi:tRNA threonylcarbamoyladenosine biosynthesis protein TsaE